MRAIPDLISQIHARGGKVTPQRLLIYRLLERNPSHPTAEMIFDRVREVLPTVSLTTVYKTLNELVAIGELRRFDVNGVSHFDPNIEPHAEAVCLRCGAIVDVFSARPAQTPTVPGFRIVGQSQTLYGYCEGCDVSVREITPHGPGGPTGRTESQQPSENGRNRGHAVPEAGAR